MYESYWKLSEKPFPQRSDISRFYHSRSHQAALLRLKYGLDNFPGPAMVLGPSGTGKSSLVKVFASESRAGSPFVHLVFPALECDEMLRMIASELNGGVISQDAGTDGVLRDIHRSLKRLSEQGSHPLLCIDDAQLLSNEALQFVVQPLLNLAEADPSCHLSIILAGQPVLASKVRRIGSLSERTAVTTVIQGFTAEETASYVISRLNAAGGSGETFTREALLRLFEVTAGNPRRINRLCDMALLVGFAEQLSQITESQIDAISSELMPAAA